jgi:hypothetical protein
MMSNLTPEEIKRLKEMARERDAKLEAERPEMNKRLHKYLKSDDDMNLQELLVHMVATHALLEFKAGEQAAEIEKLKKEHESRT